MVELGTALPVRSGVVDVEVDVDVDPNRAATSSGGAATTFSVTRAEAATPTIMAK